MYICLCALEVEERGKEVVRLGTAGTRAWRRLGLAGNAVFVLWWVRV